MVNLSKLILVFAVAIMLLSGAKPIQHSSQKVEIQPLRKVQIPTSWNITTAAFKIRNTSTKTESYRGVWTIDASEVGKVKLHYNHRQVDIAVIEKDDVTIAKVISMTQSQIAYLIGITPAMIESNAEQEPTMIILNLKDNATNDFALKVESDIHHSLSIRFGVESF